MSLLTPRLKTLIAVAGWCRRRLEGPWWLDPKAIALRAHYPLWWWRSCLLWCRGCPCSIYCDWSTHWNIPDASDSGSAVLVAKRVAIWGAGWMHCPWNLALAGSLMNRQWGSDQEWGPGGHSDQFGTSGLESRMDTISMMSTLFRVILSVFLLWSSY